ncbi:hypothetical protein TRFO_32369 [Tritrichomonas foetus]|uniref:BZIP domain-containing protein n=1 Tax=Tritrichomonas foetus TaxID=1144522 RepID=A0A1J4JUC2_9EUKA|nr:hypothetical protein TRFO_32369 [Tritrichomonas foetus]|eukprot:OHT00853.1 hypothetical protein TRFO_32369 [Tritrichomonas foetus]
MLTHNNNQQLHGIKMQNYSIWDDDDFDSRDLINNSSITGYQQANNNVNFVFDSSNKKKSINQNRSDLISDCVNIEKEKENIDESEQENENENEQEDEQYNEYNNEKYKKIENSEAIRLKNRIAAKKWREKKNNMLSILEEANDALRCETLRLSRIVLSLCVENRHLEEDISFFQSFMTHFVPKKVM